MTDPVDIFREEAMEHLSNLEAALLELEQEPTSAEEIDAAFRSMHTIKGAAGMVGFDHLSQFTHHLETLFDRVREGQVELSAPLINQILEARDHIERLLDEPSPSVELQAVSAAQIIQFTEVTGEEHADPERQEMGHAPQAAGEARLYRIDICPAPDAFRDGFDTLPLLKELSGLGEIHVTTRLGSTFDPRHFDPETCVLALSVALTTHASRESIEDVFIFVGDEWQIDITAITADEDCRLGDLLVDQKIVAPDALEQVLEQQPRAGELITAAGLAAPETVQSTLEEQRFIREQQKKQRKATPEQSIKVPQHKLDQLMDQVGELVILQARLEQLALESDDERASSLAEELSRLSTGLRETTFDIRMLPIGSTFGRFRRLVRDLANDLGKEVVLETEGAETELDKVVIDRLSDPLVHLLRNSLDHGIETPEVRREKGKPARGHLWLSASQHQGQIQILIRDDGAGLDTERILSKAIERGVVQAGADLDPQEIYQLIFEAGFSTAQTVSDVSGRGVGMDVVKRSIESLQGRVQLDSTPGKGTEVCITLPMTLAIIDGLMTGVSRERYVLPLSTVEECVEAVPEKEDESSGVRLIRHRDALIPCLRLRDFFRVSGQPPEIEQTVVVRVGEALMGITVDEVVGHFQTVIKSLGRLYQGAGGVMGATIMGDGQIAMILDVGELVDKARR
ncbi:chemotaxis protein CheA [Marinobacterium stanieri]|uniref:chemotaxis protein CheA n=1 Tax=Marinobacterium stanieri TaxID=49186 RepID=UPI000255A583|nr:chemotaxis protein CheA [Marinobacterium stanieri]